MKKDTGHHCEEVFFAGFGGQGIMFMGKLLAQAGLIAGRHVTWMPSYGAEVRGGTAYSMTKISDREIASPVITRPTVLVAMNRPSLVKYAGKVRDGGMVIVNTSLVGHFPKRKGITTVNIPLLEMASKLGDARCANMIALGALLKRLKVLPLKDAVAALKEILKGKEELFAMNKKAIEKGYASV
ncbi:MAG: 2-oxoacid:acceptor oxidoreductase family protein [Candidatus Omnitrophota bacterium]